MKTKALDKRNALLKATLELVISNGFHNTPLSRVAEKAAVSPATIYLYFKDKQDLINQLYLEIKADFCLQMFQNYNKSDTVEKGFKQIWNNIAVYKNAHTANALFLAQCDNSPMIDEEFVAKGLVFLKPLLDLWAKGKTQGVLKNISSYYLYAYAVYPLNFLMHAKAKNLCSFNKNELKTAYAMAWDSIKN